MMGLFDTVKLYDSVRLPKYPDGVSPAEEVAWQTKGIDRQEMGTFRITAKGRLLKEEWHSEEVPPEEREYASRDDVDEDDPLYMAGCLRTVQDGWTEREDFHGRFRITSSFESVESLVVYEVTFTHGQLERFERVR